MERTVEARVTRLTTAAKLARRLKEQDGKQVGVVSCDVYRPAAIEQLRVLAGEIGVTCYASAIAHIWQNRLSDEGIDCEVVGDFLGAGLGGLPGAGPELWVREDQVERARKILAQHLG